MGYFKDWWKSLFSGSGETDELGFPVLKREDILPMPEVKPPKPEKDISEPVLSFIEVYKANPRRFKIFVESELHENSSTRMWMLVDNLEKKKFSHGYETFFGLGSEIKAGLNTGWMTTEEMSLVFEVVAQEREYRRENLKDKKSKLQRERLTKLYKGE